MSVTNDRINVLHVDDEPGFADLAATHLEREDDRLTVQTMTDAGEVLQRVADSDVDCIVSDFDMPECNGIELLERVQEDHPSIPFILFTGKGSEEIAGEAISAGVTDYLQKADGTDHYTILANRIVNAVAQSRSEQAVERTKAYFSTILGQASDYVMIVGDDGQVDYISPAVERVMGFTPEELDGSVAFDLVHPDDISRATAAFLELFEHPEAENTVEFRAEHADGSWRWLEVRGRNLLTVEVISGVMVNVRDITERKERERELAELKERYQAFVECSTDIVTISDETGVITYESPAVERILGHDPVERTGESAFDHIHPEDQRRVRERFEEVVERGDGMPGRVEYRIQHADGSWVWMETVGTDQTGTVIDGYVATSRDITERKEHEEELQRQNRRLDEFASILSHDLRNPLNVAQGRLQLVRETCESEHFDPIERAHARMEALILDLLMLAREGKRVRTLEPIDLPSIVDGCWANADTQTATIVNETTHTVRADESRLQQVFENLFRNAIDHGGDGITVTVGDLEDGFFVEDDGTGSAPENREHIFEPGFTTSDSGTGFGLYIVKEIVEALNWEIRITEGSDGGARFEITGVEFVAT